MYEMGWEHLDDLRQLKPNSHMLKHILDRHGSDKLDTIEFRIKVLKLHKSVFERQIDKAVTIQRGQITT